MGLNMIELPFTFKAAANITPGAATVPEMQPEDNL
jgi:hypothetical protein